MPDKDQDRPISRKGAEATMDFTTYIAIYLPIFILLFVIIPAQDHVRRLATKRKRRKRIMTNELLKKYVGKTCYVSTGSFGTSVKGEITQVEDNWIEVVNKKGSQLINADFVTSVQPVVEK
jgi:hypothetical protein